MLFVTIFTFLEKRLLQTLTKFYYVLHMRH